MNKLIVLDVAIKMPDDGLFIQTYEFVCLNIAEAKRLFLSRCEKRGIELSRVIFCGQEVK
jgi:hypothetical protein